MSLLHGRRNRRGATIVEFAAALPALLAMSLGVVDIGRLLIERQRVVQATFETIRYAAQGSAVVSDAEIESRAEFNLRELGMDTAGLVVDIRHTWDSSEPVVHVTVEVPVTIAAGLFSLPAVHSQTFSMIEKEV